MVESRSKTLTESASRFVARRLASVGIAVALALMAVGILGCSVPAGNPSASSAVSSGSSAAAEGAMPSDAAATVNGLVADVTITSPTEGFAAIEQSVTLSPAATALDALEATGADVSVSDGEYGAFVESINGLANGSAGSQSGWTYTVNGEYATVSAGDYQLTDGDRVEWTFYV